MDKNSKTELILSESFLRNAHRWQLAESIQDHIDKLNALVEGMTGEDFQQIQKRSRASYLCILMDYLRDMECDFKQFCDLCEAGQQDK